MEKRRRDRPRGTIGPAAIITNEQFVRVFTIARRSGRYAARADSFWARCRACAGPGANWRVYRWDGACSQPL